MSRKNSPLGLRKLQADLYLSAAVALVGGAPALLAAPPASIHRPTWDAAVQARPLADKDENDVVIKVEELPKSIRDYIAKDLPGSKITEARKDYGNKEHKGDKFIYEVDVTQGKKEYEFKFSQEGKLLKKREEAGDEPAGKGA